MSNTQPFLGLYVTAVKSGLGLTDTYLRGMQRIRQSQIDQISASGQECTRWLKQAETVRDFDGLHNLQSDVLSQYMERVSSYWDKVGHDMTKLQLDLSGALQDCNARATHDVRHEVGQLQNEVTHGTANLFKPFMDPAALFGFSAEQSGEEGDEDAQPGDHNGSAHASRSAAEKRRASAR